MNIAKFKILILFLSFISCTQNSNTSAEFRKGNAVFSIKIKDPNNSYINIKSYGIFKHLDLDNKGFTIDTIENITEGYFIFSDKRHGSGFFIQPGDSIAVTLDTKDFLKTIKFSGDNVAENNYLTQYFLLNRDIARINSIQHLAYLDEKDFLETIDSVKTLRMNLLETYNKGHNLNDKFYYYEKNRIYYEWINRMETYEDYHKFAIEDTSFRVSKSYYNFRKNVQLDNASLIIVPSYHYFLSNYYQKMANNLTKKDSGDVFVNYLKIVGQKVQNKIIRERLLYSYALKNIEDTKELDNFYLLFDSLSLNNNHKKNIYEKYKDIKRFYPGEKAPNFTLQDIKGNNFSLADYRGKYVYLDIWATWCMPCKREFPYLEKLQAKFDSPNLIFISISVDSFKDTWRKFITQNNPKGIQLFGGDNSTFKKLYKAEHVPQYMLINPEGKFSTATAPRPSETEVIELLFNRIVNADLMKK